ncbi:hypothetical protein U1Q18_035969 [Sarracenia purpurea var. burkii]
MKCRDSDEARWFGETVRGCAGEEETVTGQRKRSRCVGCVGGDAAAGVHDGQGKGAMVTGEVEAEGWRVHGLRCEDGNGLEPSFSSDLFMHIYIHR